MLALLIVSAFTFCGIIRAGTETVRVRVSGVRIPLLRFLLEALKISVVSLD